jgi:Fic family protein
MSAPRPLLIWQLPDWPNLQANDPTLLPLLLEAREWLGRVQGAYSTAGLDPAAPATQDLWQQEALATSAIEGESLNPASVRSSVMRRLGLGDGQDAPRDERVDGLVAMLDDATRLHEQTLDEARLCRWHAALFPSGYSGMSRIRVGQYRDHGDAMQIVSGLPGREVVHYTAPPSAQVANEMRRLLAWVAHSGSAKAEAPHQDGVVRAAIAHLWFESIHPFEDGNGRIGRAIVDMVLARDAGSPVRFISLSRQLLAERKAYYAALQQAQHGGSTDVSPWVMWFVRQLVAACRHTCGLLDAAQQRSRFWMAHGAVALNARQHKVVQRLLDLGDGGFLGGLNAEKYMKLTGASKATATRDMAHLVEHGLLWVRGQGKATHYFVNVPGWAHAVETVQGPPAQEP